MVVVLALAPGLLASCGNARTQVPSLTRPSTPRHFRSLNFPRAGLTISVPVGWTLVRPHRPLVIVAASGNAVIALWRFVRAIIPTPVDVASLEAARSRLVAAARARQRGLHSLGSRLLQVDGHPAIVLETIERIGGLLRRVRSLHVYAPGEEVVLEEYAPSRVFDLVSRRVFVPVRRSLLVRSR